MSNKIISLIICLILSSCFLERGDVKELKNRLRVSYLNDEETVLMFTFKGKELLVHDGGNKIQLISGSGKRSVSDGERTLRMSGVVKLVGDKELKFLWDSTKANHVLFTFSGFEQAIEIENKKVSIEELFQR